MPTFVTVSRFLNVASAIALMVLHGACTSQKESVNYGRGSRGGGAQLTGGFDPVARRLDSLAALSDGDFIHFQVGHCFGRCEGFVSIFRESPAKFHIYEGEAWSYNEFDRADILYRLRKPIRSDQAEALIEKAKGAGIMKLVMDTTYFMTDHSYIWVRARIGDESISIDRAYLGGKIYSEQGLNDIYIELRKLLLGPLFGGMPKESGEG